jgi:putative transposase
LLKIKIHVLFEASDGTYGYRRMHAALARGGERAGEELVRQLMRELGLVASQPVPWRLQTTRQGAAGQAGEVHSLLGEQCGGELARPSRSK